MFTAYVRRPRVHPLRSWLLKTLAFFAFLAGALVIARFVVHGHGAFAAAAILAAPVLVYVAGRPLRGLEIAVLVVLLMPPQTTFGAAQLGVVRLTAMLVLLALFLDIHNSPRVSHFTLVDWAVIGLVGWTLLSWGLGAREPHSLRAVSNYILPMVFFAGGRRFGERAVRRIYTYVVVVASLASFTVLYEALVTHRPLFSDPTSYYWLGSANYLFRPGGVFGSPPAAAAVLAMVMPCGLVLLRHTAGVRRLALAILLLISTAALFFTYTRGPEIGLIVGIFVYAVLLGPATWARYAYGAAIIAVVTSVVLLPKIESSGWFQKGIARSGTLSSRQVFWDEAQHVIRDSPTHELIGHGPESLIVGLPWLPGSPQPDIALYPDLTFKGLQNQYLRMLTELGVVGLALFLGWIGGAIVKGARAAFGGVRNRHEVAAGVAGCVVFCVDSLVGDTLWEPQVFATVALLSGIVVSLGARRSWFDAGSST